MSSVSWKGGESKGQEKKEKHKKEEQKVNQAGMKKLLMQISRRKKYTSQRIRWD